MTHTQLTHRSDLIKLSILTLVTLTVAYNHGGNLSLLYAGIEIILGVVVMGYQSYRNGWNL